MSRSSAIRCCLSVLALLFLLGATAAHAQTLLSQGRPVTASSTETTTYPATAAVDGNTTTTRWSSVFADPQWIYVDLGATYSISRVVLTWEAAYGSAYQIQVSNDAASWTSIYTTTTGNGATDDLTGLSGSGRYVRMNGTVRATAYGYSLFEFQVYGTSGATPTATRTATATATATATTGATATRTSTATATATTSGTGCAIGATCEAETAALGGGVVSSTQHAGYTGAGFADYQGNGTGYVEWTVNVPTAGTYALNIRYGNGGTADRPMAIAVNGTTVVASLSFPVTGWTTWTVRTQNATLPAGTVRIRATELPNGPNVDNLIVTAVGATPTATATTSGQTPTATRTATATATRTATATATATATTPATPTTGSVVSLFDSGTALEPALIQDTGTAIVTRVGDRARDRHARESEFHIYDHYLSHYWTHRTAAIELQDKVAKGGTELVFNVKTQWPLGQAEFRCFFRGINTVAEYNHNVLMTFVSGPDANGVTNYTTTMNFNAKEGRNIQIGDRVECEISQFLNAPPEGRANYYGTAILYIVGQGGFVPWEAQGAQMDSFPLPQSSWMGGRTTLPYQYSNEPEHRFKQTAGNIAGTNIQSFMLGRRLHHTDFGDGTHSELTAENGVYTQQVGKLGPRFYARRCVECHINNGRSIPPGTGVTLTTSVTKVGTSTGAADPNLGSSLQPLNTGGAGEGSVQIASYTTTNATFGDGGAYSLRKPNYTFAGPVPSNFSVRSTPPLVGLGLLEAISESTVSALADPNDSNGDGISGRMQTVSDPQTGQTRMGRFGWKAGRARLRHQIAGALNADMGVTNSVFPNPDCGSAQTGCGSSGTELSDADLELMVRYVSLLGVAARRNLADTQAQTGETQFTSMGCAKCHTPNVTTSAFHPNAELRGQTIHPYTDLLLHDMGAGLADNLGEGAASGAEWRTPPLWSLGLTAGVSGGEAYLHDGRARSLTEAILWHGGEGEAAKEAFRTASSANRAAIIKFLQSL